MFDFNQNRNPKVLTKLKHIVELDQTKNIYIFPNEYCKDTAIKAKCSVQEKEIRLQINALKWYQKKIVRNLNFPTELNY